VQRNARNEGYARGNNQAMEGARGEWFLLLNNDAELAPDAVRSLLDLAAASPSDVGMLACRVMVHSNPHIFDSTGLLIHADGVCRSRGWEEKDLGQYDAVEEVLGPHGAAAFYRRAMIEDVGAFDETYFAYLEDSDLALRAQLRGWRCLYAPGARVHHHKSRTFGNYSKFKAFHVERNRIYTAVKLLPLAMLLVSPFRTLHRYRLQWYAARNHLGISAEFVKEYSFLEGVWIILRAHVAGLASLPALIKQRRAIARTRTISKQQWRDLFRRFRLDALELALKF
jgi:GT2 family glycosyltransferase